MDDFLPFGLSFLVNIAIALLIVRYIYSPARRDKAYVLMFLAFNTLVFLVCTLLGETDLSVGFGLSLFALFSLLRFRTDPIPIREMTYLFVMMALPVINVVTISQEAYAILVIADLAVAGVLVLVEKEWGLRAVGQKSIIYERIEWAKPEHFQMLLADLRARTGLDIIRCEIGKLDFLHDTAEVKITYSEPQDDRVGVRSFDMPQEYSGLFSESGLRRPASDSGPRQGREPK